MRTLEIREFSLVGGGNEYVDGAVHGATVVSAVGAAGGAGAFAGKVVGGTVGGYAGGLLGGFLADHLGLSRVCGQVGKQVAILVVWSEAEQQVVLLE